MNVGILPKTMGVVACIGIAVAGCAWTEPLPSRTSNPAESPHIGVQKSSVSSACAYDGPNLSSSEFRARVAKFETEIDTVLRNHGNPEFFNFGDPNHLLEGEDGARYDSLMDRIPKGGVARFFSEYCDLLGPLADTLNSVNVPDDPRGPLASVDVDSLQRELNAVVVRYPDISLPQALNNCLRWEDGESSLQEDLAQSHEILGAMDADNQEALDWASEVMEAVARNLCPQHL